MKTVGSRAGTELLAIPAAVAGALALLAGVGISQTVLAAESEGRILEEVVVTSRKREESLQGIPESVTVFTGAQLETANVETMRDFIDLTPNVIIRETFRSNESFITMRGIASAQGALPPVAIVVDGVQVGSNDFINQDLLDIERVEVLRGPQGALYGQGAIAGAINIVTRAPSNDTEGYLNASLGNANSYRLAGSFSTPLIEDRLFVRLSGYQKETDGLVKNQRGERITFDDEYALRGRLLYQGDRLSTAFRASYTEGDGSCCIQDRIRRDENGVPIEVDKVTNPGASANVIGREETRFIDASLKLDYDFENFTLTSITGYADALQDIYGDLDFTNNPIQVQDIPFTSEVLNQELRITSSGDSALRWQVGAFYQDRNEVLDVAILDDSVPAPKPVAFGFVQEKNSELWAVFGQVNYDVTEALELTAALRYDYDRQDSNNTSLAQPYAEATFKELQPKLQLSYDINDDVMAYVTWSEGFRTGGFSQTQKFENEVASNYEAGMKSTLMGGLMTVNASVFYIDYANQQLSFVILDPEDAANTLRGVLNVPATDIHGLELEVVARPTSNLDVNFSVGMSDTSIAEIDQSSPFASPDAIGKASPLAPTFTFNAGFTYTRPLAGAFDLLLHGNYRRRGGYYFDLNNTIKTDTADFVDGKIALESERWTVGAYGRNLTDTRHATNVSITGADLRIPNQPRSYGIEASYRF